jgi:hypothetical protein
MLETSNDKSLVESTLAVGSRLASTKWAEYCEGLEGTTRDITALLLENEAQYLASLDETTKVVNIGNFYKFAFPMVRAIFPNLVAMDIVSVQPMAGPVSLVFYLDFIYGTTKGDITAGDRLMKAGYPHATAQNEANFDGHDSKNQYSSEFVNLEDAGIDTDADGIATFTGRFVTYKPVRPTSLQIFFGESRTTKVLVATANADGSFTAQNSSTLSGVSINHSTGALAGTITLAAQAEVNVYFSYKYAAEGTDQVMEIDLQLQSTSVQAERRALKAKWSVEAANDLKALHQLDVEAELTAVLADEIRFEIDREIIQDLDDVATSHGLGVKVWSKNIAGINYAYYERKMELYDEFIAQSNNIFRMTRRAGGNFIVAGIEVSNVIEALPGFQPANVVGNGVVKTGTIRGQWDVFKDPYYEGNNGLGNEYIMGYKGSSFLDAGFVFAPYIPLYTTPTYVFADFVGTKGMMSRYGKKVINNRFYVKGRITD